jgi:ABC-type lipoprotein export system ATPase subunit
MLHQILNHLRAPQITSEPEAAVENHSLIDLHQVVKTFKTAAGEFTVLKGIDAQFKRGEFVGIIGKSGSGKSTLVNMITGIDRPTSGEVYIAGSPIHTFSENQLSTWRGTNLGIVFQFFQLLPTLTLLENIMLPMDFTHRYPLSERKQRAMDLLRLVDMQDHAFKLPSAISGGQQQRVAIARALSNDPPILIADEPTGNLDSRTAESVFQMFESLAEQGKTVVMVTHDSSLAKRVSRTLLIADGEVVNEWVARALPTLTHTQMLKASHNLKELTFAPGQRIIQEQQHPDTFYIVSEGVVEVVLENQSGMEVVVAQTKPGQYFGEIEILHDSRAIATVRAGHNPVKVLALDEAALEELLAESEVTRDVLETTAHQRMDENKATRRKRKTA